MAPALFPIRVRFYELDPYGHVNHATYLQYFEAARVAWLGEVGQGLDVLKAADVQLVVTGVAARFIRSAVLDDELVVETALVATKRVRAQWAQQIYLDGELVVCQRINFATVNTEGRPIRMPEALVASLDQIDAPADWFSKHLPDLSL